MFNSLPSSVLSCGFIGVPSMDLTDFTILEAQQFVEADKWPEKSLFGLVVHRPTFTETDLRDLAKLLGRQPFASLILISAHGDVKTLTQIPMEDRHYEYYPFPLNRSQLESSILKCFERSQKLRQEQQFKDLVSSQTESLSDLQTRLENRIALKQAQLIESKEKVFLARGRFELLQQCVFLLQSSKSAEEFRWNLSPLLQKGLKVDLARVLWTVPEVWELEKLAGEYKGWVKTPILYSNTPVGEIVLGKRHAAFTPSEVSFLEEISEIVSLFWDRLQKLQRVLDLKENWQVTFDAIENPVALISESYDVIQANKAFFRTENGAKCFEILFSRKQPCPDCKFGQSFLNRPELGNDSQFWQVTSQKIKGPDSYYLNHYHEMTEKIKMESNLLQNAKTAEIGVIASSLAHELNNPLGALLNFIQLLKADLPKTDPLTEDLQEMEAATKKSRDLIQNILSFAREVSPQDTGSLVGLDLINQTIQFLELLYRFRRIKFPLVRPSEEPFIIENPAVFKQILRYLLTHLVALHPSSSFDLKIEISVFLRKQSVVISLESQKPSKLKKSDIRLALAQTLIKDLHGTVEIAKSKAKFVRLEVMLPLVKSS